MDKPHEPHEPHERRGLRLPGMPVPYLFGRVAAAVSLIVAVLLGAPRPLWRLMSQTVSMAGEPCRRGWTRQVPGSISAVAVNTMAKAGGLTPR
jgi:hypothetical protein